MKTGREWATKPKGTCWMCGVFIEDDDNALKCQCKLKRTPEYETVKVAHGYERRIKK